MKLVTSVDDIRGIVDQMRSLKRPVTLGFTGVPPDDIMDTARSVSSWIIDLDMPVDGHDLSVAEDIMPKISCATLRTIAANCLLYKNIDWIIMSAGYDKCDGGRFLGMRIGEMLDIPVVLTDNRSMYRHGNPICESGLPLREKMQAIVDMIASGDDSKKYDYCEPQFGFWGVPPNDFSVLDLFPSNTHIFGWARCMENRTPANFELEEYVNPDLPTVFFAQAFCAKNILAYDLAEKHNGLYVEVDSRVDRSIKAKIEAFLWMHGRKSDQ